MWPAKIVQSPKPMQVSPEIGSVAGSSAVYSDDVGGDIGYDGIGGDASDVYGVGGNDSVSVHAYVS